MITISECAGAKVRQLLDRGADENAALHLRVTGGGCSGLRYDLAFDHRREGNDELVQHGVPVLVDAVSAMHAMGCLLDYADSLDAGGSWIENPNAAAICGCGESFSV